METLDLNNGGEMTEMVPIDAHAQSKGEEKNVDKDKVTMDSTPIADIMGNNEVMMDGPAPVAQDPRVPNVPQVPMPQMQAQAHQMTMQMPTPSVPESKNPMNLTDDQMEALFVGVVATIAFSKPVQEKLASMIPQFVGENGARSTTGLAVTGAVAAGIFYFGRRFLMKN